MLNQCFKPTLQQIVSLAHACWWVELDYRELKDELGLDQFEGRHWLGFHHHITLVSIACAFLRIEELRPEKKPLHWPGSDHLRAAMQQRTAQELRQ